MSKRDSFSGNLVHKASHEMEAVVSLQIPPLPGKLTPLHHDHFHHQGA
jgi:hypothetical protein